MKLKILECGECDEAVAALREQGLTVRFHNSQNNTWHIADGGLYSGYVATCDELVELKRKDNLNIHGIKSLDSGNRISHTVRMLAGNERL